MTVVRAGLDSGRQGLLVGSSSADIHSRVLRPDRRLDRRQPSPSARGEIRPRSASLCSPPIKDLERHAPHVSLQHANLQRPQVSAGRGTTRDDRFVSDSPTSRPSVRIYDDVEATKRLLDVRMDLRCRQEWSFRRRDGGKPKRKGGRDRGDASASRSWSRPYSDACLNVRRRSRAGRRWERGC